jgi:hypothetical protein
METAGKLSASYVVIGVKEKIGMVLAISPLIYPSASFLCFYFFLYQYLRH